MLEELTGIRHLHSLFPNGPIVVGATGGSGTRVVARILRQSGVFIGTNLNVSEDPVELGEFSDRWVNRYALSRFSGHEKGDSSAMKIDLAEVLARHTSAMQNKSEGWGWKEPRSILYLPFLHEAFPSMRFIHLVRDGRDMALSSNQNQLRKHGEVMLRDAESAWAEPHRSIALWSRLNVGAAEYGEGRMAGRYHRIRFEDLCMDPRRVIDTVLDFLGITASDRSTLVSLVQSPDTLQRWRNQAPDTINRMEETASAGLDYFGYRSPSDSQPASSADEGTM